MHGGQPLIEKEAFELSPGQLSSVIAVDGGKFVLLRCLGRTKPVVQDMADVREELEKDIHEKKLRLAMAEEFDRLKDEAQIDNFLVKSSQPGRRAHATPVNYEEPVPRGIRPAHPQRSRR